MNGQLSVFPTPDDLTRGSAGQIASVLSEAVSSRACAMMALSGGMTPRGVYAALASHSSQPIVPWMDVHVFWGDERCVLPDHLDSNFRMANEALLQHVPIPSTSIHRIQGEIEPVQAAIAYEKELRQTFRVGPAAVPRFDLVLLGLGSDGHIASLFPGTPALNEHQRLVTEVFVQKLNAFRVTLTLPVINYARHVLVLVSGESKAAILADVFLGSAKVYPAQLIEPSAGDLHWLVDQDAASRLGKVRPS